MLTATDNTNNTKEEAETTTMRTVPSTLEEANSAIDDNHHDIAEQGLSSPMTTVKNKTNKDILPVNGKYFAYFGLFVLFVDWTSVILFILAMKHVGLKNWKWNRNPVAMAYDSDYLRAQQDPEMSAQRSLNVHVVAAFSGLLIAVFQIVFTLYFHRPPQKDQHGQNTSKEGEANMAASTTTAKRSYFFIKDATARYFHRNVGRMLIIMWLFVYVTGIIYFITATTNYGTRDHKEASQEWSKRVFKIFLFLYTGSLSLANFVVGYWAVAIRKVKDYMLHKSCMGFALVSPSGIAYGKIIISAVQLSIGPRCLLNGDNIVLCLSIGFVFQFFLLTSTMYLYDRRLFQLQSVKWNMIGYLILCLLLCSGTAISLLSSPSGEEVDDVDKSCF